jgi:hypothetical protein
MTDNQGILTGWKEICAFCGIKSKVTMKRKAKKYKMPIQRTDGIPSIDKEELIKWHRNLPHQD